MIKNLWPVLFLLTACSSSPTAPTRVSAPNAANLKATVSFDDHGFSFQPDVFSHCVVKNVSDHPMIKGCILQDMKDPKNPTDAGHGFSSLLQPGDSETITYFVTMNDCDPYQFDGLDNIQPWQVAIKKLTESDINNNHVAALGQVIQKSNCRNEPCIIGCEPVKQCSASGSFNFPGTYVAAFPASFVDPIYPRATAQTPALIPVGAWALASLSGDNHSQKQNEYPSPPYTPGFDPQKHEIYVVEFYHNGVLIATSGPTKDLPLDRDSIDSPLGVMVFTQTVTSMRAVSAGVTFFFDDAEQPNDSIYPLTLSYKCP